jgi:hypothetical protein
LESAQPAVGPDCPVARDNQRERVVAERAADRARGFGPADVGSDAAVGAHPSARYAVLGDKHAALKAGAAPERSDAQVESDRFAFKEAPDVRGQPA